MGLASQQSTVFGKGLGGVNRGFEFVRSEMCVEMYHLPHRARWDPQLVCSVLQSKGFDSSIVGDSVRISIPCEQDLYKGSPTGPAIIEITYRRGHFLRNVDFTVDWRSAPWWSGDPEVYEAISASLQECGCLKKSDRQIADIYGPGCPEVRALLEEIERLDVEKENLVAEQNFEQAKTVLDRQNHLRREIDRLLI